MVTRHTRTDSISIPAHGEEPVLAKGEVIAGPVLHQVVGRRDMSWRIAAASSVISMP